jgi:hypothetical protein
MLAMRHLCQSCAGATCEVRVPSLRQAYPLSTPTAPITTPIHCASPSQKMAFRPLLRQVTGPMASSETPTNLPQRALVPAMAAVAGAGIAFSSPRMLDAEEPLSDSDVRRPKPEIGNLF